MADYGLSLSRSDLSVFFYYRAIGTSGCWMRWPEGFYVFPTEPRTKAGLESRSTVPSRLSKDGRRYHLQPYEMLYFFRHYLPIFALALGDAHSKDVGMFRPVTFFCQTFHLLIFLWLKTEQGFVFFSPVNCGFILLVSQLLFLPWCLQSANEYKDLKCLWSY